MIQALPYVICNADAIKTLVVEDDVDLFISSDTNLIGTVEQISHLTTKLPLRRLEGVGSRISTSFVGENMDVVKHCDIIVDSDIAISKPIESESGIGLGGKDEYHHQCDSAEGDTALFLFNESNTIYPYDADELAYANSTSAKQQRQQQEHDQQQLSKILTSKEMDSDDIERLADQTHPASTSSLVLQDSNNNRDSNCSGNNDGENNNDSDRRNCKKISTVAISPAFIPAPEVYNTHGEIRMTNNSGSYIGGNINHNAIIKDYDSHFPRIIAALPPRPPPPLCLLHNYEPYQLSSSSLSLPSSSFLLPSPSPLQSQRIPDQRKEGKRRKGTASGTDRSSGTTGLEKKARIGPTGREIFVFDDAAVRRLLSVKIITARCCAYGHHDLKDKK